MFRKHAVSISTYHTSIHSDAEPSILSAPSKQGFLP